MRIEVSEQYVSPSEFRELVRKALDELPRRWAERLDNVAVVVEEEPSAEDLTAVGMSAADVDELLGLYEGIPLEERGVDYGGLPDRIVIYRGPTLRVAATREEIVQTVRETVLHELGHHFGLEEEDLPF